MATNGNVAPPTDQTPPKTAAQTEQAAAAAKLTEKDKLAAFFVQQYYEIFSNKPERLHLFYGTRQSQFIHGREDEKRDIAIGRKDIKDRISELGLDTCKVLLTSVDAQESGNDIVIQVIGESANANKPPRKFVQTFVITQTNLDGDKHERWFVLNDILRYLNEEGEGEGELEAPAPEPAAEAQETAPEAPASAATEPEKVEPEAQTTSLDTTAVEQKLQEVPVADEGAADSKAVPATNNDSATEPEAEKSKSAVPDSETAERQVAEEDAKEGEKPQDPAPTPVAKPAEKPAAAPEPTGPPKPMTWARVTAPKPVVPLPKTATPPATVQSRAPAPPAAAQPKTQAPAAAAASAAAPAESAQKESKESSGWQTAGADSKRQNRPQSVSAAPQEKEGTMGYVKFVTEKVQDADLKAVLAAHGELTYFDINRSKNCAFVEFKSVEGYQAAVAASPLSVNGEQISVEPRRPKSTAYGGSNYGSVRGGPSGRGRGNFDGNRTGGQGNPRGNFSGQNRGRGGSQRGRGGAPAPSS